MISEKAPSSPLRDNFRSMHLRNFPYMGNLRPVGLAPLGILVGVRKAVMFDGPVVGA
jgi:hypothetical protein